MSLDSVLRLSFNSAIRFSYRVVENDSLDIALNEPVEDGEVYDLYLWTGDKVNKLFAKEIPRLFCKLPNIKRIKIGLATDRGVYMADVTAEEVEKYYNISFADIRDDSDPNGGIVMGKKWVSDFINHHDNKEGRKAFVDQFVRFEK